MTFSSRADVAVVIATRNRSESLALTLGALSQQRTQCVWEIVIVDDGSTDDTRDVVEHYRRELIIAPIIEEGVGSAAARSRGMAQTSADLIVLTDDDVEPVPGWLSELHTLASRWPAQHLFGGPIVPRYPRA